MTETTVHYHADGLYETGRPSIDVKDYHTGEDYWPPEFSRGIVRMSMGARSEAIVRAAYERVQSDFWQAAQEIAEQNGLGEIAQEGRSGGWLVFTDGRDPQEPGTLNDADTLHGAGYTVKDWLAGYRSMVEWADAFIADAPRKVRDLAQQLAMDEAGEPAARRMFAFERTLTLAEYRATEGASFYEGGQPS
jgi:hypothetical protein